MPRDAKGQKFGIGSVVKYKMAKGDNIVWSEKTKVVLGFAVGAPEDINYIRYAMQHSGKVYSCFSWEEVKVAHPAADPYQAYDREIDAHTDTCLADIVQRETGELPAESQARQVAAKICWTS